jgi:hypothetical protein
MRPTLWFISIADVEPMRLGEVGSEVILTNSIILEIQLTFRRSDSKLSP